MFIIQYHYYYYFSIVSVNSYNTNIFNIINYFHNIYIRPFKYILITIKVEIIFFFINDKFFN